MNKRRRKELRLLADKMNSLYDELCGVASEEQESYDNLPESLQESERGELMSEAADELDDICSELDDLRSRVESVADEY